MSDAMRSMPQYQEMLDKYSLHIHMANQCMAIFQTRNLTKIAGLEQDMATGEDAEGKPVKNIMSVMPTLLQSSEVSLTDKLRLLMLYIISQEGIKESDRKKLMQLAGISTEDQSSILNLRYLGITLTKATKTRASKKEKKEKKKEGQRRRTTI